jgi:plastocyanin
MMNSRLIVVLAALVVSVVFPFMPVSDAQADDATIVIEPGVFSPHVTTIHAGDRVTWSNRDNVEHFLTSSGPMARPVARSVEDLEFHQLLEPENNYSHAFTAPGAYPYFCAIHLGMTGTVVVEP